MLYNFCHLPSRLLNQQNYQMLQYKAKGSNRVPAAFPFSAYILRSYSSEPAEGRRGREEAKRCSNTLKQQQQFYGLIQGCKLIQQQKDQKQANLFSMKLVKHDLMDQFKVRAFECEERFRKYVGIGKTHHPRPSAGKNVSLSPLKKKSIYENKSIQAHFRYQIVSLYSLLNRKEDFLSSLKGKKQLLANPMKASQLQQKLEKLLDSKGKDRGRQKYNHITSEQLRAIKYKPKVSNITSSPPKRQSKAAKDSEGDEQQEQQQEERRTQAPVDIQVWKRNNGIAANKKVFIIKGGYADLRKELLSNGWYENTDVYSPYFNLKWTTKICDINYLDLRGHQSVNHFNNNHHLTSKYGLTRRLRTLALSHGVDIDRFYPRCFDLGDQVDFQNFVQNFKFGFAESVAKRFVYDKKRYEKLQLKMWITVDILKRRSTRFMAKVQEVNKGNFLTILPEEWEIITETAEFSEQEKEDKLKKWRKKGPEILQIALPPLEEPDYEAQLYQIFDQKIKLYLSQIDRQDPQLKMNGYRNVWIVKPNFMSRGRGIRCYNNLYDIADYCLGRDVQFVAQKYIEHPLVIEGRKFDIRQWVLVEDFNPPRIWFYKECYLRFCADEFSLDNIYNRFIHLTNNSIQKHNKKANIDKSMWTMGELSDHLGQEKWLSIQEKIKNIVVWSIKSCEGYVLGRKGSCELVGYDFMIDENLNPWLIEINMSPSMDYSTPVTKKLVKMVLTDTAKVISAGNKSRDIGGFECIYRGNQDLPKFSSYNF